MVAVEAGELVLGVVQCHKGEGGRVVVVGVVVAVVVAADNVASGIVVPAVVLSVVGRACWRR